MQSSRAIFSGAMLRRAAHAVPAATHATCTTTGFLADSRRPIPRAHSLSSGAVLGAAMVGAFASPLTAQARFAAAKNPYTVLNIKQTATKEEIKKAYRVMARKHHPDAPGGNHEKFQEIQEAYESIKSGVWVKKGGEDGAAGGEGGGGGESENRYSRFRYTTRTHRKSKVSYDQFYTEMHTGKVKRDPFADDEDEDPEAEAARKDPRRNPLAMNEIIFQAWLRFIIMWCLLFTSLRLGLFFIFPPKWEKPQRKPPPRELKKKLPPPKPLAQTGDSIVA